MSDNPYDLDIAPIHHRVWDEGYDAAYDTAYWKGYREGFADGENEGNTVGYEEGYADGFSDGAVDADENDNSVTYPSQEETMNNYVVAMTVQHSGKTLLTQVSAATPEEAVDHAHQAYGHEPTGVAKTPATPRGKQGSYSPIGQYLTPVRRVTTPAWELEEDLLP